MSKKKRYREKAHNSHTRHYTQVDGEWVEDESKRERARYNPKSKEYEVVDDKGR